MRHNIGIPTLNSTRIPNEMGTGEPILLCRSLETGRLTEYWDKVKQQPEQQHHPSSYMLLHQPQHQQQLQQHLEQRPSQLNDNQLGQKHPTRASISATSYLHESIKCVLNLLMDTNQTGAAPVNDSRLITYDDDDEPTLDVPWDIGDYALPGPIPYQSSRGPSRNRSTNHSLVNSLLSSTFRQQRSNKLCRLTDAIQNYYLENCVAGQDTAAALNSTSIAYTDTIRALSTTTTTSTSVVTTELGGLLGNGSIMAESLNQLHTGPESLHQQQLTYHWNFLFFVIIFIIAGGLGNILVCLAIALDRKLQNVTNYFLLSLAIADLLVSLFVMPLGAIPTFLGGHWPLGVHWCNVYVTCDVLACSASIWHMCFISLGRYLGIKNPLGSRHRSTKRIVGIKIAVAWLMAMPVSSSIAILGSFDTKNIIPQQNVCTINNKQFFVYGSLVAFYIPMVIMVSTYALTVQLLRKKARFAAAHPESEIFRSLMSHRLGGGSTAAATRYVKHSTGGGCDGVDHVGVTNFKQPPPYFRSKVKSISETDLGDSVRPATPPVVTVHQRQEKYDFDQKHRALAHSNDQASTLSWNHHQLNSPMATTSENNSRACDKDRDITKLVLEKQHRSKHVTSSRSKGNDKGTCSNHKQRLPKNRKRASLSANAVANEQKATKVLGIVFFTFVLCWAPFFVLNIVLVVYPRDLIPDHVIDVCLWLGYVSSTINPIIYTIFNRTFRAAFIRLLRCNCQRSGRPYRYRSVTETKGAASLCARSALPLAISLQGTGFFNTSSSVSNTRNTSTTVTDSEC